MRIQIVCQVNFSRQLLGKGPIKMFKTLDHKKHRRISNLDKWKVGSKSAKTGMNPLYQSW